MLTLVCPNCRHRFPAASCCASVNEQQPEQQQPRVTISTGIQSGGCLIQSSNAELVLDSIDRLQLRSKLSGGGCLVQNPTPPAPPSQGCQDNCSLTSLLLPPGLLECCCCCACRGDKQQQQQQQLGALVCSRRSLCQVARCCRSESAPPAEDLRIQLNATVHLPTLLTTSSCTISIATATTTSAPAAGPGCNNFSGGGIVSSPEQAAVREEAPGTPISWLACPWPSLDPAGREVCSTEKDAARLVQVRRLLQACGWYHEALSWQQSESLLKDAPLGRWLLRDSSDPNYTFAISVQTARGPTSIRVHYANLRFRLDAEPRLAQTMPTFDCPIRMAEHYCEYSKRDGNRQEVWVDYSGQIYSQIYLAEPLVKEVRSLTHLARVTVNKNADKLERQKEKLPPLFKNYLKEYPYTL